MGPNSVPKFTHFQEVRNQYYFKFWKIQYIIKVRNCLKFIFIHFITQSEKYWALKTKSTKTDNQNFLILVIKVGVTYPKIWFKNWNVNLYIFDSWFSYWKISSFSFDQNALKLSEEIIRSTVYFLLQIHFSKIKYKISTLKMTSRSFYQ